MVKKRGFAGTEFEILPALIERKKPIACHILMEVHAEGPWQIVDLHRKLSKAGYYLYSYELNGYKLYRNLCEFSFLHKSCFDQYGVTIAYESNVPD